MGELLSQNRRLKSVSPLVIFVAGVTCGSITLASDIYDPPEMDLWCGTEGIFEAPIKMALNGEAEALNRANLVETLPLPIPNPAVAQVNEIARLFNQVGVEIIEARSSELKEIFEPLPDPDPPNLENQVRNHVEHALLFVELLQAKINKAEAKDVLSTEGAEVLRAYAGNARSLIEVIPITIP
jgi:hypothetical protein